MINKIKPSRSDVHSLNPQSSILNPFQDLKETERLFSHSIQHRTMKHSFHPRKRFGQHFLVSKNVIDQIIDAINPQKNDNLVEIGPGFGALTTSLLPWLDSMAAIELDRAVIPFLQTACENLGALKIYNEDALRFDFSSIVKTVGKLRIVGNLPYNISSPLIFHLLKFCDAGLVQDMHFMVQKELADRLASLPNSKDYGRLSIMVQYHCQVEELFTVSPDAFNPIPKVNSAVVRLIPHAKIPFPAKNFSTFESIVRLAFSKRRKTLRNALKSIVSETAFQQLMIDPSKRPEQLSLEEFIAIANANQE